MSDIKSSFLRNEVLTLKKLLAQQIEIIVSQKIKIELTNKLSKIKVSRTNYASFMVKSDHSIKNWRELRQALQLKRQRS